MTNLITADFNGTQVFFQNDAYLHATAIAKSFKKQPRDYLKSARTKEYIKALISMQKSIKRKILIEENQIVITRSGSSENGGGTWLHPKLAIDFARWLSPEFAVWCDEQIERILYGKSCSNSDLSTKSDRVPLKDAVNMLVARANGLNYSDAYKMIHHRMNIAGVEELTVEQIPVAIEYVHSLILGVNAIEGELLPKDIPEWETQEYKDHHRRSAIALMTVGKEMKIKQDDILRKLENILIDARDTLKDAERCSGAIFDGLHEAQFHLCFDNGIIREGNRIGRDRVLRRKQ